MATWDAWGGSTAPVIFSRSMYREKEAFARGDSEVKWAELQFGCDCLCSVTEEFRAVRFWFKKFDMVTGKESASGPYKR